MAPDDPVAMECGHPSAERTGPHGDDLDDLFAEQLRPARQAAKRAQASVATRPTVRQRGTLPGRLSPASFDVTQVGPAAELVAASEGRLWAWSSSRGLWCDGRVRAAAVPGLEAVSLAAAGDQVLLGDAWRGVYRLGAGRLVPVACSGPRGPVGAVWVHAIGGRLCALDSVGRLWRLVDGALERWPMSTRGRVRGLASRGSELWFLVADGGPRGWRLWRGDAPAWPVEGPPTASAGLSLLGDVAVVWGLTEAPLRLVLASGRRRLLTDRRGARLVAPAAGGSLWVVERADRDLLWLDRRGDDFIVLDLGEPLEVAGEVHGPARVRALVPWRGGCAFATDAGTFALSFDATDPPGERRTGRPPA